MLSLALRDTSIILDMQTRLIMQDGVKMSMFSRAIKLVNIMDSILLLSMLSNLEKTILLNLKNNLSIDKSKKHMPDLVFMKKTKRLLLVAGVVEFTMEILSLN